MAKKFSLLMAAIAVVAFAVPAFASAAPSVTKSGGGLVETGTGITGSSTNAVTKTSLGNLTCATVTVKGTLTVNSGTEVTGTGSGVNGETTTCKLGTKEIKITDITLTHLVSTTQGKGTITVTFEADLPNNVTCHFSSSSAPFTYSAGGNSLKLSEADLVATPAACEPGLLSGDFKITLTSGGEVVLD